MPGNAGYFGELSYCVYEGTIKDCKEAYRKKLKELENGVVSADITMNDTKTKNGLRDYPLDDEIIAILNAQKAQNLICFEKEDGEDDYIFKSETGKVISRHVIKSAFNRICNKITEDGHEFERISPHSFRHSYVTQALGIPNINVFAVQMLVGHSTGKSVTFRVYLGKDSDILKKTAQQVYEFRKERYYDNTAARLKNT